MALRHEKVTGFSGNEIFCLNLVGLDAGRLCLGNNVLALGMFKGIGAGISNLAGGEIEEITNIVRDGRRNAYQRMLGEARESGGTGLAGVSFDLVRHGTNVEFIATGSAVQAHGESAPAQYFSASADGQQLYCQIDAGFTPHSFVFGNVAYSIGVGGSIGGAFRGLQRGEVPQYTKIFDETRHRALNRIKNEAKATGANAVIGIRTSIMELLGTQEMIMTGTSATHPALTAYAANPVTSDMRDEELWNMVHLGYMPLQLVMGVSVYSLGFVSGIGSMLKSLVGGQVNALTELLYEAREKAFDRIQADAERCGADKIVGVKTRIYDLGGGLVEFMVIGTAVKKIDGVTTLHAALPPQAIISDEETFIEASTAGTGRSASGSAVSKVNETSAASASATQKGPISLILTIVAFVFFIIAKIIAHGH